MPVSPSASVDPQTRLPAAARANETGPPLFMRGTFAHMRSTHFQSKGESTMKARFALLSVFVLFCLIVAAIPTMADTLYNNGV
jgi:hypothetical protein